jgi:hypothetical protein
LSGLKTVSGVRRNAGKHQNPEVPIGADNEANARRRAGKSQGGQTWWNTGRVVVTDQNAARDWRI